jgi:hypothetical protein
MELLGPARRGVAATVVMSVPMLCRWALDRREPPPPMVVAENAQRALGLAPERYPAPVRHAAWTTAHLGFGATLAVVDALVPLRGSAFGLAAWTLDYALVLPRLGLYPSPARDARARLAVNVLAHIVFARSLARRRGWT